jgi:acetolactate synthase-1/2/3 large subunit
MSAVAQKLAESLVNSTVALDASDLIVAYLEQLGVEYVFGVPGGAIEPLYNALARSARRGGPRPVTARHEAGAAYMADGYARETGNIGVCMATSGPGATNMITGVACAYENNIPMLAITGQPALPSFGRRALQESSCTGVNVVGMMEHCTRYNSLISHGEQMETKLVSALIRTCQSPQGPAHLSIPVDILRSSVGVGTPSYDLASLMRQDSSLVDDAAVRELRVLLKRSQKIVFLLGGGAGVGEAAYAIIKLAEMVGALFVTTPEGKGFVNPRHPSYRGVFGLGGHASAAQLLGGEPDLVLAFGTAFGELSSNGWSDKILNGRLVHIDDSPDNLMRSPMARLHVRGRIRSICERLAQLLPVSAVSDAPQVKEEWTDAPAHPQEEIEAMAQFHSDEAPLKPQRLMKELSLRCPPQTRFVADAGNSFMWSVHCLDSRDRRAAGTGYLPPAEKERRAGSLASWLRVTMDFAPMGWGIGCAVGVARGNEKCPVVCITGDGSYLMSGQEITTAAEEGLCVVFVILNDGVYGMVMHGQRLAGAEPVGFQLPTVEYRFMAISMGIAGHVVTSPKDLENLPWGEIVSRQGPTIIDVRIDREEVPPMGLRMKTLGSVQ